MKAEKRYNTNNFFLLLQRNNTEKQYDSKKSHSNLCLTWHSHTLYIVSFCADAAFTPSFSRTAEPV
ncbi:MAG: glycine-rich domain-containing protein-like [Bacteroidales bacterium]|nr:glycine-rich domain-containing protein-like [Bacteroidales bacterium]